MLQADRRADAIVVNEGGITVRRSLSGAFNINETWTNNAFLVTKEYTLLM
ncbi:MAG: hypothetical protein IPH31_05380 [Lewinellaceae bacterium]|nr:hypothetical protein [Lewinellaceae bacterium]